MIVDLGLFRPTNGLGSGSSPAYCGTGCNTGYGTCTQLPAGLSDTTNGLCGTRFNASCKNYGNKNCCSQSGFWYALSLSFLSLLFGLLTSERTAEAQQRIVAWDVRTLSAFAVETFGIEWFDRISSFDGSRRGCILLSRSGIVHVKPRYAQIVS